MTVVRPNEAITMSGRARCEKESGAGGAWGRIRLLDQGGTLITQHAIDPGITDSTWTRFSVEAPATPNATWAIIDLYADAMVGEAWFDHIDVRPTSHGSFG